LTPHHNLGILSQRCGGWERIAGCFGSKVIVAINKDKEATIFNVAHFGIVADFKEVLPALTAKSKELKSK
jgi:electron transfer flavoprotein alpha subunit